MEILECSLVRRTEDIWQCAKRGWLAAARFQAKTVPFSVLCVPSLLCSPAFGGLNDSPWWLWPWSVYPAWGTGPRSWTVLPWLRWLPRAVALRSPGCSLSAQHAQLQGRGQRWIWLAPKGRALTLLERSQEHGRHPPGLPLSHWIGISKMPSLIWHS